MTNNNLRKIGIASSYYNSNNTISIEDWAKTFMCQCFWNNANTSSKKDKLIY